jgi:hypothetical protein
MRAARHFALCLGAALALAHVVGCELINTPGYDGIVLRSAEVASDTVHIAFIVDVPQEHWSWSVDLDTDQARDANGHKTGYGELGIEYRIDSRDRLADSVAIRPTSGPVDTSVGARGWPIPIGFARLDPSTTVSLRFPTALIADDGIASFRISVWEDGYFSAYLTLEDSTRARTPGVTTPRPGSLGAVPRAGSPRDARPRHSRARG